MFGNFEPFLCFQQVSVNSLLPAGLKTSWKKRFFRSSDVFCLCFQGGKSEIFVDVIERMTVVIGSNVSNTSVTAAVTLATQVFVLRSEPMGTDCEVSHEH